MNNMHCPSCGSNEIKVLGGKKSRGCENCGFEWVVQSAVVKAIDTVYDELVNDGEFRLTFKKILIKAFCNAEASFRKEAVKMRMYALTKGEVEMIAGNATEDFISNLNSLGNGR